MFDFPPLCPPLRSSPNELCAGSRGTSSLSAVFHVWASSWSQGLYQGTKFVRSCEKKARGVDLGSTKPFIVKRGCERKTNFRSGMVSVLAVGRGILELFSAGKLELEIGSVCNKLIIYPWTWIYSWCSTYKRLSTPPSTSLSRSPCPADFVHGWAEPWFPSSHVGVSACGWGQRQMSKWPSCSAFCEARPSYSKGKYFLFPSWRSTQGNLIWGLTHHCLLML